MTTHRYEVPVDQTQWHIGAEHDTVLTFDYDGGRDRLVSLYERGKDRQWNASTRLDWSIQVEPGSPENGPDHFLPLFGSPVWDRMTEPERRTFRHHLGAWITSQFLHGEQGALVCASKIVQIVPDVDCKFYAATQVVAYVMQDEARPVAFGRLSLRELYPQLTQAERDEREEFVVYASYLMRDRFLPEDVYARLGLPVEECLDWVRRSEMLAVFQRMLFSRIVPTVRDLGLFGPKVQHAFADLGVIEFAGTDPDDLARTDEDVAREWDLRRMLGDEAVAPLAELDPDRAGEVAGAIEAGRD